MLARCAGCRLGRRRPPTRRLLLAVAAAASFRRGSAAAPTNTSYLPPALPGDVLLVSLVCGAQLLPCGAWAVGVSGCTTAAADFATAAAACATLAATRGLSPPINATAALGDAVSAATALAQYPSAAVAGARWRRVGGAARPAGGAATAGLIIASTRRDDAATYLPYGSGPGPPFAAAEGGLPPMRLTLLPGAPVVLGAATAGVMLPLEAGVVGGAGGGGGGVTTVQVQADAWPAGAATWLLDGVPAAAADATASWPGMYSLRVEAPSDGTPVNATLVLSNALGSASSTTLVQRAQPPPTLQLPTSYGGAAPACVVAVLGQPGALIVAVVVVAAPGPPAPVHKFTWYRDGVVVNETVAPTHAWTAADAGTAGVYAVRAWGPGGASHPLVGYTVVVVTAAPTISVDLPSVVEVGSGDTTTIHARVSGPGLSVRWEVDGVATARASDAVDACAAGDTALAVAWRRASLLDAAANVTLVVSNAVGAARSRAMAVTVAPPAWQLVCDPAVTYHSESSSSHAALPTLTAMLGATITVDSAACASPWAAAAGHPPPECVPAFVITRNVTLASACEWLPPTTATHPLALAHGSGRHAAPLELLPDAAASSGGAGACHATVTVAAVGDAGGAFAGQRQSCFTVVALPAVAVAAVTPSPTAPPFATASATPTSTGSATATVSLSASASASASASRTPGWVLRVSPTPSPSPSAPPQLVLAGRAARALESDTLHVLLTGVLLGVLLGTGVAGCAAGAVTLRDRPERARAARRAGAVPRAARAVKGAVASALAAAALHTTWLDAAAWAQTVALSAALAAPMHPAHAAFASAFLPFTLLPPARHASPLQAAFDGMHGRESVGVQRDVALGGAALELALSGSGNVSDAALMGRAVAHATVGVPRLAALAGVASADLPLLTAVSFVVAVAVVAVVTAAAAAAAHAAVQGVLTANASKRRGVRVWIAKRAVAASAVRAVRAVALLTCPVALLAVAHAAVKGAPSSSLAVGVLHACVCVAAWAGGVVTCQPSAAGGGPACGRSAACMHGTPCVDVATSAVLVAAVVVAPLGQLLALAATQLVLVGVWCVGGWGRSTAVAPAAAHLLRAAVLLVLLGAVVGQDDGGSGSEGAAATAYARHSGVAIAVIALQTLGMTAGVELAALGGWRARMRRSNAATAAAAPSHAQTLGSSERLHDDALAEPATAVEHVEARWGVALLAAPTHSVRRCSSGAVRELALWALRTGWVCAATWDDGAAPPAQPPHPRALVRDVVGTRPQPAPAPRPPTAWLATEQKGSRVEIAMAASRTSRDAASADERNGGTPRSRRCRRHVVVYHSAPTVPAHAVVPMDTAAGRYLASLLRNRPPLPHAPLHAAGGAFASTSSLSQPGPLRWGGDGDAEATARIGMLPVRLRRPQRRVSVASASGRGARDSPQPVAAGVAPTYGDDAGDAGEAARLADIVGVLADDEGSEDADDEEGGAGEASYDAGVAPFTAARHAASHDEPLPHAREGLGQGDATAPLPPHSGSARGDDAFLRHGFRPVQPRGAFAAMAGGGAPLGDAAAPPSHTPLQPVAPASSALPPPLPPPPPPLPPTIQPLPTAPVRSRRGSMAQLIMQSVAGLTEALRAGIAAAAAAAAAASTASGAPLSEGPSGEAGSSDTVGSGGADTFMRPNPLRAQHAHPPLPAVPTAGSTQTHARVPAHPRRTAPRATMGGSNHAGGGGWAEDGGGGAAARVSAMWRAADGRRGPHYAYRRHVGGGVVRVGGGGGGGGGGVGGSGSGSEEEGDGGSVTRGTASSPTRGTTTNPLRRALAAFEPVATSPRSASGGGGTPRPRSAIAVRARSPADSQAGAAGELRAALAGYRRGAGRT